MSTPEAVKTRGTFFPAAEATTPRRSPRLAARRLYQRAEAPGATVSTPVRSRSCTIFFLSFKANGTFVLPFLFLLAASFRSRAKFAHSPHARERVCGARSKIKIVTGLPWERFQNLIFCVVVARSSSFPLLTSLCAPANTYINGDSHIQMGALPILHI